MKYERRTSSAKSSDLRHNTWLRCSTSSPTSAPGNLAARTLCIFMRDAAGWIRKKPRRLIFQRREPSGGRAAGILAVSQESARTFCGVSLPSDALKPSRARRDARVVRPRPHFVDKRRWKTLKTKSKRRLRLHHSSARNCFNEAAPLLTGSLLLFSFFSKEHYDTYGLLILKTHTKKNCINLRTIPADGNICMSNCSQDGNVNRCWFSESNILDSSLRRHLKKRSWWSNFTVPDDDPIRLHSCCAFFLPLWWHPATGACLEWVRLPADPECCWCWMPPLQTERVTSSRCVKNSGFNSLTWCAQSLVCASLLATPSTQEPLHKNSKNHDYTSRTAIGPLRVSFWVQSLFLATTI